MKIKIALALVVLLVGVSSYVAYSKNIMGFRDKIDKRLGREPKVDDDTEGAEEEFPEGAIEGGTNILDIEQPKAGTGAIPIHEAEKLQEYQPKPDETINTAFQQELYKQIFLPYDRYPYLYDNNYRQALTPTTGDLASSIRNPTATVFGYRPPIQGGDVPQQDINLDQYYQQLYNNYGMYPPGGGGPAYNQYFPSSYPYPYGLPPNYPYGHDPTTDNLDWLDYVDAGETDDACQYPNPPPTHGNRTKCTSTYGGNCLVECQDPCSALCKDCVASCGPDAYDSAKMAFAYRASYRGRKQREKIAEDDRLILKKQLKKMLQQTVRNSDARRIMRQGFKFIPAGRAWQKGFIADIARN